MKRRKPRKPKPFKFYGSKNVSAECETYCIYIQEMVPGPGNAKHLHKWLGRAIAYLESKKEKRK